MKRPMKRECRLARAKVNSTSSLSYFSGPVPANSSFPGASDAIFFIQFKFYLTVPALYPPTLVSGELGQ